MTTNDKKKKKKEERNNKTRLVYYHLRVDITLSQQTYTGKNDNDFPTYDT